MTNRNANIILCLWTLCVLTHITSALPAQAPSNQLASNKYKERTPIQLEHIIFGSDAASFQASTPCHQDVELIWKAELGSPISSSPLITDLHGNGKKEIIVATSLHYIEVLRGEDGFKLRGWPFAFPRSSFVTTPLLYDIDKDGVDDIVVSTQAGEIVFLKATGQPLYNTTLKIPQLPIKKKWYEGLSQEGVDYAMNLSEENNGVTPPLVHTKRKLLAVDDAPTSKQDGKQDLRQGANKELFKGMEGYLTDDGLESLELFLPSQTPASYIAHLREQLDPLYSPQYTQYMSDTIKQWDSNKLHQYVLVDPHILATPVIVDIDSDGNDDLIVPVSYYFDVEQYNNPINMAKLDIDVDISKYVAGGLVVFDLTTMEIKWTTNFDLTPDTTGYRAYMYATPTIADLNQDGRLDVVVSTALGRIYALHCDGTLFSEGKYPLEMDALYAPVVVEDLNGDGDLELIAVDQNSNIVCYSGMGDVLWEARLSGYPEQAATVGDVDGDGELDIVVATNAGHVWAVRGTTGKTLPNYPVRLKGRVQSQVLLIEGSSKGMMVVVYSLDGHVYIIEGPSGCADKIDIGEPSYSMVMVDDMTGGSDGMDLIVSTKQGNIFCLGTSIPYHPLKAWTSANQGRSGYTVRTHRGIFVTEHSRTHRDIMGSEFTVTFEIVDHSKTAAAYYDVKIRIGSNELFVSRYYSPGVYGAIVAVPHTRTTGVLHVTMMTKQGLAYFDEFSVSFNRHFHRTMKWIIIVPFIFMAGTLLFVSDLKKPPPLPQ